MSRLCACINVCRAVHPDCKGGLLFRDVEYCLFPQHCHTQHGDCVILGSKLWKNEELAGDKSVIKQSYPLSLLSILSPLPLTWESRLSVS